MIRAKKSLVRRYAANPILTAADFPGDIVSVFNAGAVKQDGRYLLVCRCEDSCFGRYMWVAESEDGIRFTPRPEPLAVPSDDPVFNQYVDATKSYWDPRVTEIDGQYYITHAADVTNGKTCQLGLFKIDRDFRRLEWMGLISEPDNRNGVLFPEKINGLYWRLDRPNDNSFDIWASASPDLEFWGHYRRVLAKETLGWGEKKIGPGSVPIKTDKGWLCIMHGVRRQVNDEVYSLGVMLLDLAEPWKLIGQSKRAILAPELPFEFQGQSPNVVFTNGSIAEDDGTVKIYYGAADQVLCLAESTVGELLGACLDGE
ncbi:glycoside hydrolase family 130 protein [Ruficoccus amylovorans]|uniref:Glycoside hydrolase family 130 protein n=1 Tax=Ruficoccus amylovorans TaxID=1804625 RepID=A0A842HMR9_9BACT|nr:glycoside hydrolase family 130 protein [Ruficoccus amylovorans]MBC2596381.1 glycoside hydrolase family 130 protein [Ruficoccus amylovorans]